MRIFLPALVLLLMCTCGPADSRKTPRSEPLGESPIEKESGAVAIRRVETAAAQANCQYDNAASMLGMGLVLAPKEFTIYNDASLQDVFAASISMRMMKGTTVFVPSSMALNTASCTLSASTARRQHIRF